jgi:hypothetical protein
MPQKYRISFDGIIVVNKYRWEKELKLCVSILHVLYRKSIIDRGSLSVFLSFFVKHCYMINVLSAHAIKMKLTRRTRGKDWRQERKYLCFSQTQDTFRFTEPPAVAFLNYKRSCNTSAGFSPNWDCSRISSINLGERSREAAIGEGSAYPFFSW